MRRPSARVAAAVLGAVATSPAGLLAPAAASAAPIRVASVTPAAVAAPGTATVVFRLDGAATDSTALLVLGGTEFGRSAFTDEVQSLSIVSAGISGKATLSTTLPPLAGFPPNCERGGVHASSSVSAYKLKIPARDVSALVVKVKVPRGFAGQTPELEVRSTPLQPSGATVVDDVTSDDVVRAAIPRTGPTLDGVEMKVTAATDVNTYVARGRIVPPRGGAMVRLVGRSADDWPAEPQATTTAEQLFGDFPSAMAPIGSTLAAYAKTRTSAAGRYAVRFTAPRGTVIIARSRGIAGTTVAGASCPVQLGG